MAGLQLDLPAVPSGIPAARAAITRLCETLGIAGELRERIRFAVTEACTNCVLHAYPGHADATYRLEARLDDAGLVVMVRDCGVGIANTAGAAARRARLGHGLGLKLIARTASSMDVTSTPGSGTCVAMRFALTAG